MRPSSFRQEIPWTRSARSLQPPAASSPEVLSSSFHGGTSPQHQRAKVDSGHAYKAGLTCGDRVTGNAYFWCNNRAGVSVPPPRAPRGSPNYEQQGEEPYVWQVQQPTVRHTDPDYGPEATEPAFLQRLRGAVTSGDSSRHERPIPRNKRLQKDDDDDDEPTYVLEDSNQSLSKAEYDAMVAGKDPSEPQAIKEGEVFGNSGEKSADQPAQQQPKDNIAEIGKTTKKRKAIRVIGADDEEEHTIADGKSVAKAIKKPKKKAKAVKLSFGDPEEG